MRRPADPVLRQLEDDDVGLRQLLAPAPCGRIRARGHGPGPALVELVVVEVVLDLAEEPAVRDRVENLVEKAPADRDQGSRLSGGRRPAENRASRAQAVLTALPVQ